MSNCTCGLCTRAGTWASPVRDYAEIRRPSVVEPPRTVTRLNADEVRTVSKTGGEKGDKLERYDLIPVGPLREVARLYGMGARKYADRNWERGYPWHLSYAAMMRHLNAFWDGQINDEHTPTCPDDCVEHTGMPHLAAAIFHAMALLEFTVTHPEYDDRPQRPQPETGNDA